jgi:hypothetical protein
MAAIEYGSYYWCVVLNEKDANTPAESVHLHADSLTIDPNGSLTFRSAGRRPAGAEPKQQDDKSQDKSSNGQASDSDKDKDKDKKDEKKGDETNMIYMAFGPGTWRVVYAARLQDGAPAVVEHWNATDGKPSVPAVVPANSGATGYSFKA